MKIPNGICFRSILNIWKFPFFVLSLDRTTKTLLSYDVGRLLRLPNYKASIFLCFSVVLTNRNVCTIYFYRIKVNKFFISILKLLFVANNNIEILIPKDKCGPGLIIYHNMGSIVRAKSIGKNCTISQGVTIGEGGGWNSTNNDNIPIIGDNVLISTNSIVIGNISIGDNSIIGAGSVITKNVPNNAVVIGNPQKILKYQV